jgi:drug/metabolite transporter (DMT)-like permease
MTRSTWITFLAFCLLAASAWIAEPFDTSSLPGPLRQSLLHAIIGLIALALSARSSPQKIPTLQLALTGILFFGVPVIAIDLVTGSISAVSRSALFALVPVVVILTIASGDPYEPGESAARNHLIPALTALSGLFLLLTLNLSTTPHGTLMIAVLLTAIILAGVSAVWLHRMLQHITFPRAIAIICLSNAAFLLLCSLPAKALLNPHNLASTASPTSLIDTAEILLLLWLLRAMPPVRFAARYLLIPLLTVAEGFLLVRPLFSLRIAAGTLLLVAGTALLLFLTPSADEDLLSLR